MENTNCGADCPFVKQGFCQKDCECPHYVESWWTEQESGKQKLVKDCAPHRLMIDSQIAFNRSVAVQATIDKLENRLAKLESLLQMLIAQSQSFLVEQKKMLQINQGEQP